MDQTLKIAILGDISPTDDYRTIFDSKNPYDLLGRVVDRLIEADIAIANMEAPATISCAPIAKNGPNLKAKPQDITLLKDAGINVLSLANNHILDYGQQGVIDTLDTCRKVELATVGGGEDESSAKKTLFITVKNKTIAILSFAEAEFNLATKNTAGANHFDSDESFNDIKEAKEKCEYLIVLYHGGNENYIYPSPLLQKKCRKMATRGADLVLCQHSHCIGTIEKYDNSTILYGQGNSVFGYVSGDEAWNEGLLVEVSISEYGTDITMLLINATKKGIILADEATSKARVDKMNEMSLPLSNADELEHLWNQFCKEKTALYFSLLYGRGRIFNKLNRMLNNLLMDVIYTKKKKMTTMNLICCEAHNEVDQTIFKNG